MARMLSLLLLLSLVITPALADNGVSKDVITFGQSAALKGPAAALGKGMRDGILTAFKEINDRCGIHGKKLRLITYDDGYEPEKAIQNTKKLINYDRVFALIGGVGTPTANAVLPIITRESVPFIAPFTGAELLRNPFNKYVVNLRASYEQETEAWIEHLTKDLGIKRIAIFYQEDSYGLAGLAGVEKALSKRKMKLVAKGTYQRNTTAVKRAIINIRKANPEAIVMTGAYKPCAKFIRIAKQLGIKSRFVNLSFVGSEALAKELKDYGKGVIVSQVVPSPHDADLPVIKDYHNALRAYNAKLKPGFVSLEGYLAGRLAVAVLQQSGQDIKRKNFIKTIYSHKNFELGGLTLSYDKLKNQGMDSVFMTVLGQDGQFTYKPHLGRP